MNKLKMSCVVLFVSIMAGCGLTQDAPTQDPDPDPAVSVSVSTSDSAQAVTVSPCFTACRRANMACIRACIHDPGAGGDCGCPDELAECEAECSP
jgi:hypothetical protein